MGAVVVREGSVIAAAAHLCCGGPHAEARALERAGPAARGATLYVTLEPCRHHGRTPPCTDAIIRAGIKRVVALTRDPNPSACGGADALRRAGLAVDFRCGTRQAVLAARLNAPFFKYATTGLPFVTAKHALSAEGVMSVPGKSVWFTGPEARKDAHRIRSAVDAVVVGTGTVLADDPLLDTRLLAKRRDPVKIIFDTRLRTPPTAKLLRSGRTIIVHGSSATAERRRKLEGRGTELFEVTAIPGGLDVRSALLKIASIGLIHLLLEAGPRLQSSFMDAGLVDEIVEYRTPRRCPSGLKPLHFSKTRPGLKKLSTRRLGRDIKYVYAVNPAGGGLVHPWEEKVLCLPE